MLHYLKFSNETKFYGVEQVRKNVIYSTLKSDGLNFNPSSTPLKTSNDNIVFANQTQAVSFKDKQSGQNISLRLSVENIAKLQAKFKAEDFNKDERGELILSGEAQELVAGWFGDIAYRRGYLKADANNDGMLDGKEMQNTTSEYGVYGTFSHQGRMVSSVYAKGTFSYAKTLSQKESSIENELNISLKKDVNMDGTLTLSELESKDETLNQIKQDILNTPTLNLLGWEDFVNLKREEKIQKNIQEKLENNELEARIKQSGMSVNLALLDESQKEKLKQELPTLDELSLSIKEQIKQNLSLDLRV